MKEVKCPYCSYKFMPGSVMCSYPFQVDCPKCHKRFYLDTEGHSAINSLDIPGVVCFKGNPKEKIGKTIRNTRGISKIDIK